MADETSGAIAASAATALGNYAVQVAANKKQFKYQKQAMALQQEYNKELWDYQNAYNTPQQQMERFKAAGLNPYLIYGGGSSNAGNAGPISSTEVPSQQAVAPEIPDAMMRYLQVRQMDAQYAATMQNIDSQKRRSLLTDSQTAMQNLKLMREQMRSKNYKALEYAHKRTQQFIMARAEELYKNESHKGDLMAQMYDQRAGTYEQGIRDRELDITFKTYRNELAKFGVYSSDHPILRTLLAASARSGIPLEEYLKKSLGQLQYLFK